MRYGSICSGIEAATVAWHPIGWKPAFFSEIDKFPRAVLSHHYFDVPLHGDFTTIQKDDYAAIDLLVGGTPCQSFSVAGLRKGFADERGNLTLEFIRLAERLSPKWLVWENVPGVLSQDRGRAFGSFLGGLAECGYGFAYRILDAQYFGVPQRRRRVFVVGYFGDWRPAAAVLFERESLCGDITPSREKGENVAGAIAACSFGGGAGGRPEGAAAGHFQPVGFTASSFGKYMEGCGTVRSAGGDLGGGSETLIANTLRGEGFDASEDGTGRQNLIPIAFSHKDNGRDAIENTSPTLQNQHNQLAVAFAQNTRDEVRLYNGDGSIAGALAAEPGMKQQTYIASFKAGQGSKAGGIGYDENLSPTLSAADSGSNRTPTLMNGMAVRRLTPRECERLQGFPDDYTLIPYRGKSAADGPRYKALGNSMAVPVMRWLGERVAMVNSEMAA